MASLILLLFFGRRRRLLLLLVAIALRGAAHPGNGTMLAINVDAKEDVPRIYEKALSLGAACEGKPGPRANFGDFAYFRDTEGNKLAVFHTGR